MSQHSIQAQNYEEPFSDLPTERTIAEGPWTLPQQRLLAILQHTEHRNASVAKFVDWPDIPGNAPWYQAMKDECFVAEVVETLGITLTVMLAKSQICRMSCPTAAAGGPSASGEPQQIRQRRFVDWLDTKITVCVDKGHQR